MWLGAIINMLVIYEICYIIVYPLIMLYVALCFIMWYHYVWSTRYSLFLRISCHMWMLGCGVFSMCYHLPCITNRMLVTNHGLSFIVRNHSLPFCDLLVTRYCLLFIVPSSLCIMYLLFILCTIYDRRFTFHYLVFALHSLRNTCYHSVLIVDRWCCAIFSVIGATVEYVYLPVTMR